MPTVLVPLSKEDMMAAASFVEKLEELDEVNTIYDNIKQPEA